MSANELPQARVWSESKGWDSDGKGKSYGWFYRIGEGESIGPFADAIEAGRAARAAIVALAALQSTETIKSLIESLRARFVARQRLTSAAADGALVSIARGYRWHVVFNGPGGRSFMVDQLAEALAEADAWLDHDDLAEQWATLGCDREGRVIEPNWANPL